MTPTTSHLTNATLRHILPVEVTSINNTCKVRRNPYSGGEEDSARFVTLTPL